MSRDELDTLHLLLPDHHRRIEEACTAFLGRSYADDPPALIREFRSFERALLEHMAAEEDELVPGFARDRPDDAAALRAEHHALRDLLDRIGLEVELHVVRVAWVEELIARLRVHAAIEDTLLYPWARVHLSPEGHQRLTARVAASLRELAGAPRRPPPAPPTAELR